MLARENKRGFVKSPQIPIFAEGGDIHAKERQGKFICITHSSNNEVPSKVVSKREWQPSPHAVPTCFGYKLCLLDYVQGLAEGFSGVGAVKKYNVTTNNKTNLLKCLFSFSPEALSYASENSKCPNN